MIETATVSLPILGGWLDFLWLPSWGKTEKARQELLQSPDKEFILAANPLARAFVEGELKIGDQVKVAGKTFIFKGVYPKEEYPGAMVFYDHHKGKYFQYNFPIIDEFEIVKYVSV